MQYSVNFTAQIIITGEKSWHLESVSLGLFWWICRSIQLLMYAFSLSLYIYIFLLNFLSYIARPIRYVFSKISILEQEKLIQVTSINAAKLHGFILGCISKIDGNQISGGKGLKLQGHKNFCYRNCIGIPLHIKMIDFTGMNIYCRACIVNNADIPVWYEGIIVNIVLYFDSVVYKR